MRRPQLTILLLILASGAARGASASTEQPYLAAIKIAMDRMMAGMMTSPSGDVDRDFVAMMTPGSHAKTFGIPGPRRFGSCSRRR